MGQALTRACLAILAALVFCAPAAAQETMALSIEGWQQQEGDDGVVYYRCASDACAAGSVVSYKAQPHRPELTLADFEKHHRGLADHYKGTGNMRDVRIADAKERTIEGVRVLQVRREVDWTSNKTTFSVEARLIGPDRSFSLVSDSPKQEWTDKNFEGFLRSLVVMASLKVP
jgi:hypothetical protein